jgi:hypothetical protein
VNHHVLGHRQAGRLERQIGFVFVHAGVDYFVLRHENLRARGRDLVAHQGCVEDFQVVLKVDEIGLLRLENLQQTCLVLRLVGVRHVELLAGGRQDQIGGL